MHGEQEGPWGSPFDCITLDVSLQQSISAQLHKVSREQNAKETVTACKQSSSRRPFANISQEEANVSSWSVDLRASR